MRSRKFSDVAWMGSQRRNAFAGTAAVASSLFTMTRPSCQTWPRKFAFEVTGEACQASATGPPKRRAPCASLCLIRRHEWREEAVSCRPAVCKCRGNVALEALLLCFRSNGVTVSAATLAGSAGLPSS